MQSKSIFAPTVVSLHVKSATHMHSAPYRVDPRPGRALGTGFLISDRTLLTALHVARDASTIRAVVGGRRIDAHVIQRCEAMDIALLELTSPWEGDVVHETTDSKFMQDVPVATFRDELPITGETMHAVGYHQVSNCETHEGKVVQIATDGTVPLFQTDAVVNPGMSGGPCLDTSNRVIGMCVLKHTEAHVDSVALFLPARLIQFFLDGQVGLAVLPITRHQDMVNPSLRKRYKLDDGEGGQLIHRIQKAHKMLKPDDVLLRINGLAVSSTGLVEFRKGEFADFTVWLRLCPVGARARLQVLRRGETVVLEVALVSTESVYMRREQAPRCIVVGGVVFVPLTMSWIQEQKAVGPSIQQVRYNEEGCESVVAQGTLADDINEGYDLVPTVVKTVNRGKFKNWEDFVGVVKQCRARDLFLEFDLGTNGMLVLECAELDKADARIAARYGCRDVL